MAESESVEALRVEQQNGEVHKEKDTAFDEEEQGEEASQLRDESQQLVKLPSFPVEFKESQLESCAAVPLSSTVSPEEDDQCAGLEDNSGLESHVDAAEFKEQDEGSGPKVLGSITNQGVGAQTTNQLQSSSCPTSLSELSPTSVTQPISSAPSPTQPEPIPSPSKLNDACTAEADQRNLSKLKSLSIPVVKAHIPDGYNWRKYGQKQVKSPKGSRSYYKCTYSACCAKKIECADHSGHVIEIVNKGTHTHAPPQKNNCTKESKVALLSTPVFCNSVAEHPTRTFADSNQLTLSKESKQEPSMILDKKRQNSSDSNENGRILIKEEHASGPEPKRRMKKENLECSGTPLKPGKKPKFVVHAVGDVGIAGDGYRWRKYGQKMVKGNPNPRNYYRCTSAGCPVRKHIETATDNTDAVIITYKGVHDHDMPVPKKRHGPPSAPLVAAAAPTSLSNSQLKKTDTLPNQPSSTQRSAGKEGELTGETLDVGGEKEKAIESARTLLSIGFEIKPC